MRSGRPHRATRFPAGLVLLAILALAATIPVARAQFTRFQNYSEEQGLGNATVSAIAQDPDGYLLFGTEAGLFRFDGVAIRPWDAAVGLPSGATIRKLMVDGAGRVVVLTDDSLFVRFGERFFPVAAGGPVVPLSPHLVGIVGDRLLVARNDTLLQARIGATAVGPFAPLFDPALLAATPALRSPRFVAADADGAVLVGCGNGLCRVAGRSVQVFGPAQGLPADQWQVALRTPDDTIWLRSLQRLAWKRPGQTGFRSVAVPTARHDHAYDRIPATLDLVSDRHGGVLTQGEGGILGFDGTAWNVYAHHEGGLAAAPIESLLLDREDSLWGGSFGHGVFRSMGLGVWEHWAADDGLGTDLVWGMSRLADRSLWVATFGSTVPLDGRARGIPGGSAVVVATTGGRLWAAPPDEPLVRLDPASGRTDRLAFAEHVRTAFIDRDDSLWLCTEGGLFRVANADGATGRLRIEPVLASPAFQVVADPAGTLWALTRSGLFRRDPAGGFASVSAPVLPGNESGGLAFAPDGTVWISTESRGVLRFRLDGGRLQALAPVAAPTIGSSDVLFLHRDRRDWMWVGTDHGLDMFDGHSWRRFDKTDGVISNDMDQWAVYEDKDGSLWFGTSHGLTHLVDPGRLPQRTVLHPRLLGISLGSRSLAGNASIRSGWTSQPLVIRFVDLDFARGGIAFRYRLRGVDPDWTETPGHDVRYARLPVGTFRFELVSVDPAHGAISAPIGFTIRIRAPWWRRWWFYGLCVLATASLVAATWLARERLLLRQQRRLEGMVDARTAEIEHARNELQRLALSDALTGLPNRRAIMGSLEEALNRAARMAEPLAVLLCDIDHFKQINDGFGHLAGDTVLASFGARLGNTVSPPEAAGRYGGEEFLVILPAAAADAVMRRVAVIRSAIGDAPYLFGGASRPVATSGGVAFLRPGDTAVSLVARADMALYAAKENGRNRIETEAPAGSNRRKAPAKRFPGGPAAGNDPYEADLRQALAGEQFTLHYQPVVDMDHDTVTSCEALLRWRSPTRGNVSPAEFVPLAEAFGLMPEIGEWVLRGACREAMGWPESMMVSVNLSATQMRQPDLVERIGQILLETGLPAARLELEVTETAMIDDMTAAIALLRRLRTLGIGIALDDFGTGYSSLSFVRTLPFTRIKIDRSFVNDLGVGAEATAIIRAVAGLCRSLDASLTAEGVETDGQIELLCAMGCSELQGYAIGRPCPAPELQAWMAAFQASHPGRTAARMAAAANA